MNVRNRSIGAMRSLISIEEQAETAGTDGANVGAWSQVATAWADISPVSGREFLQGAQVQADVTHKITMRHQVTPSLSPRYRLVHDARTFQIVAVLNIGDRDRYDQVMCKEVIA